MSDARSENIANPTECFESYRSKETAGQSDGARREATAIRDAATDAIARRAQNPEEIAGTRIGKAHMTAAGIPAILKTFEFGFGEMGPVRTAETLTRINQRDGFDCQSCAWGNPDHRKVFEFCENGAKALADEATRKRITREFFAEHSVLEMAEKSDYWLNQRGRLTEPMIISAGRRTLRTHFVGRGISTRVGRVESAGVTGRSGLLHFRKDDKRTGLYASVVRAGNLEPITFQIVRICATNRPASG